MGFFRNIRDAMNEEFVIGAENVRRYRVDPGSFEGDARHEREADEAPPASRGALDRIGQGVFLAGAALLLAHAWHEGRDRSE